jgi:hypothetical protein
MEMPELLSQNTAGLHGGLFCFSLQKSNHQKVAEGLSRL